MHSLTHIILTNINDDSKLNQNNVHLQQTIDQRLAQHKQREKIIYQKQSIVNKLKSGRCIHFFKPDSHSIYLYDLVDRQQIRLSTDIKIPLGSRTVTTNEGKLFCIGGNKFNKNKTFEYLIFEGRLNQKSNLMF